MEPEVIKVLSSYVRYLKCNQCGKQVSSGFLPMPNEMGDELVVRAWIECPECIEKRMKYSFDDCIINKESLLKDLKEIENLVFESIMTNSKREIIKYNLDRLSSFVEQVWNR